VINKKVTITPPGSVGVDYFTSACTAYHLCIIAGPTIPYKAIYVECNLIHQAAEIRRVEKKHEKIDLKEEFPF
jgi:hypothetical protein